MSPSHDFSKLQTWYNMFFWSYIHKTKVFSKIGWPPFWSKSRTSQDHRFDCRRPHENPLKSEVWVKNTIFSILLNTFKNYVFQKMNVQLAKFIEIHTFEDKNENFQNPRPRPILDHSWFWKDGKSCFGVISWKQKCFQSLVDPHFGRFLGPLKIVGLTAADLIKTHLKVRFGSKTLF